MLPIRISLRLGILTDHRTRSIGNTLVSPLSAYNLLISNQEVNNTRAGTIVFHSLVYSSCKKLSVGCTSCASRNSNRTYSTDILTVLNLCNTAISSDVSDCTVNGCVNELCV